VNISDLLRTDDRVPVSRRPRGFPPPWRQGRQEFEFCFTTKETTTPNEDLDMKMFTVQRARPMQLRYMPDYSTGIRSVNVQMDIQAYCVKLNAVKLYELH
jgi:hypothetical protein